LVLVLACLGLSAALAQTTRKLTPKEMPASAFKLIAINIVGSKRFKPEDVIATTGLQLGQTAHEDDFKQAIRILGDTGAFSDLQYSFQYSPEGTKLTLQVQDAERFVPARFDNLVWFSEQELHDKLHAQVPLFENELPATGDLADQVSNALQGLLIARNIQGRANYLRTADLGGPIDAFVFSVEGPPIHIRNVEFTGADAPELALLQTAAAHLRAADYVRSILRVQENKNFLPIYLQRGYLEASFGEAQAKVVQDGAPETLVDVIFPVDPGRQYKLADIQLSGNQVFPAEKLKQLIHLPVNQPANAVQLATDIEAIKQLYGTRGYMAASIEPKVNTDDANSTVKYDLVISEGSVYTMGDLEIRGLDSRTTARLQDDWKLHDRDPYDSSYPARFLEQAYKEISNKNDWNATVRESLNPNEKTVDVTLRFDPRPREERQPE
jgi:outer membrane protein insertion porin family